MRPPKKDKRNSFYFRSKENELFANGIVPVICVCVSVVVVTVVFLLLKFG